MASKIELPRRVRPIRSTDPRKYYIELDGIRLVIEEGKLVGWYRPGTNE